LKIRIFENSQTLGQAAAIEAEEILTAAINHNGAARLIAATGASQFTFLEALTASEKIDWSRVEMFHLDEYIGLPITHPASFRQYLLERFINKVKLQACHLLNGESDAAEVCRRTGEEIGKAPINVAFVGIGENSHLAFNDPPADFETESPYLIVNLDEACRRQQVGEGWFATLADVPTQAISMSIRQILKAEKIICIVPDLRKAQAVKACLEGAISPLAPASILRTHPNVTLYLDRASASLLSPAVLPESA
jgi:glucosamine-6-phosphate deaminase